MTARPFVPGDPRGFAPRAAAGQTTGPATTLLDGTVVIEHRFDVPIDHADTLDQARARTASGTGVGPGGVGTLEVLVREFRASPDVGETDPATRPPLLYLQGGPGSPGARPARLGGWLAWACRRHRVFMLDQRGTGASTPATVASLAGMTPAQQEAYLVHLRAPSIVADAEMIRLALGFETWTTLGQSFGGFCTLTYLSYWPEGLRACLVTGGLAPLTGHADRVYRATYARMRHRAEETFTRLSHTRAGWERVVTHVRDRAAASAPELLPDGSALTVDRVQALGMLLGGNTRVDQLHYLLTEAFDPGAPAHAPRLAEPFLAAVAALADRRATPLYTVLHESIYAQPDALGPDGTCATAWSAQRLLSEHPDFDPDAVPVPLPTGEHVFDRHLAADTHLAPLADAAERLARRTDWGPLYDPARLARNTVPVAAAVYADDVYVDRALSLETADAVGGLRVWEAPDLHHDGIADDPARVLGALADLVEDETD